ncbi:MAG: hypothetical protein DUD32_03670 [Lactobacillus sp.]|nr:MAG: hypothetical protein DUD32_03670 [Lactobacillus sp.]
MHQQQANDKTPNKVVPTVKTVSYEKLSSTDRKKVHFTFKAKRATDSKAETAFNNGGGILYNINVQIKNNTDKNISFDESQFKLHGLDESQNANSKLSDGVTIKTNTSKTIETMFKHVGDQQVVPGYAYFEYLGKYKLAYIDSKLTASGSKSDNVDNQKLIDTFNGSSSDDASSSSESTTTSTNDETTDSTSSDFTIIDTQSSGQTVTSADDAVNVAKNFYDSDDIMEWKLDSSLQSSCNGELNGQQGYYVWGVGEVKDNDVQVFVTNSGVAEEITP